MRKDLLSLGASLLLMNLATTSLWAGWREVQTVEAAGAVVHTVTAIPGKSIPIQLLREARAIAVIPHVVRAGLVLDRRFGKGILLVRQPDGCWGNPLFVTIEGGGVGLQAGIESSDMVLVFRTEGSVQRILRGKGRVTLGHDVAVAVGHLGKEVEVTARLKRKPEVFAYSRAKGLFAGLSVEGDRLQIDGKANESFYSRRISPPEVLALRGLPPVKEVEKVKADLMRLTPPVAPPVLVAPRRPPQVVVPIAR